ncbi:MAG: TIGR03862 family flavoprotein, partial [Pseudomonadota bacterium]
RVFPTAMKASPLLRRWLRRLAKRGVEVRTGWRWTGWDGDDWLFDTPDGKARIAPRVAVLALGGGSWRRLGSDGAWQEIFAAVGIPCRGFAPSNVGLAVPWSPHMAPHFGAPVKGAALAAGAEVTRGEWVITERGIEGGGVYDIARPVRQGAPLTLDLFPDLTVKALAERLARPRGKSSLANHLRKALRLDGARRALAMEFARPLPEEPPTLASRLKALTVPTTGPLPLDEAISTGGGVAWEALDGYELRTRSGTFCAGEMLDWDAPTGGYLLTACFATGKAAGQAAAVQLAQRDQSIAGPAGTIPSGLRFSDGEK